MYISYTSLPDDSVLHDRVEQGYFLDCFQVDATISARQAAEVIVDFPNWAQFLILIRRIVTTPFGLDQDGPDADDKLGPFPVEKTSNTEVIAGFNDLHLDFRVCVFSREGRVYLATWAHPHNIWGRIYLALIMPFHILIARNALSRVAIYDLSCA